MSISIIEDKLYHANFKSEQLRLESYLAVHSTLLKNKEIPRVYIQNKFETKDYISLILNQILFNDINHVVENTNKKLSSLNISTKSITDLSHDHKSELISLLEDLLLNGWGPGKIHYEYPRLMPTGNCDLLSWLENCKSQDSDLQSIQKILMKRKTDAINLNIEQNKIFTPGFKRYHPTVLSKSYQLLLEKTWKNNWSHHSNYDVDVSKAVTGIVILEDI